MQVRQMPARWRGHDERDGGAWGDERQVAVWGQVSARTLYLVVMLNVAAGFIFNSIDSGRYGPCVTVFFAIALGSTAYAGWVAHRKGVDVRAPRTTGLARLVAGSLVFGVLFYVFNRFIAGDHNDHSWPAAAVAIASYAAGFGIAMRFWAAWGRRRELHSHEAPDDAPGASGPMVLGQGSAAMWGAFTGGRAGRLTVAALARAGLRLG